MTEDYLAIHTGLHMSDSTFKMLGGFIHSELGIKMPGSKKQMVASRLRKRLISLKMKTYTEYCDYLFSPGGIEKELPEFINQITTNKTDFFREPGHFTYLENQALPALIKGLPPGRPRLVKIWCTACSKGHEPYTMAMVVSEFAAQNARLALKFSILGTDISPQVLAAFRKAVYPHDEVLSVPLGLRKKYLLKSRNRKDDMVRIIPRLREMVSIKRLNLMDRQFDIKPDMDIVFCRNVMIYFDKKTQDELLVKLCDKIRPGGYLFMGHSEVIQSQNYPLIPVAPTIYMKKKAID
ncbi:MAG: chemotaxis protein CheR [Desulfobacterium sp.]|nr:chemotaxis protein CheR [Desulfobacterium sp.]